MLKLYHVPISFNSRRVWISLLEKGLEFELIPMNLAGDQFQPEFLALNPFHHIPVLVDGDFTMIESLAILDYLEAKYPNPPLLPSDPTSLGRVKMVEMVTVNELVPAMTPLFQHSMGFAQVEEKKIEESKQKIATVLSFLSKLLGDRSYFAGDQLSLAEIVAGTVILFVPTLGISLEDYPKLTNWLNPLLERSSWQITQPSPEEIEKFRATMKERMAQRHQS